MSSTLLTDLSTDVLRPICSFVAENGDDVEYLGRTNRLLRNVSIPYIQKHRYACVSDKNPCTVPRVLRDLILDPSIAQHVESMEITYHTCSSNSGNTSDPEEAKFKELVTSNIQIYRKAVENFIPKQSQEFWISQIRNGNDDPLKALLILLSPKMKCIDWEVHGGYGWTGGCEEDKEHYFFNYLNETRLTPHLRPPINLQSLSIHMHYAYSAKEVLDVSEVIPLLSLPKLTTLILSDVNGPFPSSAISLNNRNNGVQKTSPVNVLEIKHSCLSAEGLNTILSRIVALERLQCRVSDNDGGYSSGHTDSLSRILKAIEAHTSHSLKSLNLIGNDPVGSGYTPEDLPTFRNFISLTHLKLNPEIFTTSFLLTPHSVNPPSSSSSTSTSTSAHQNHPPQPEISTLFPPNLEILELEGLIRQGDSATRVINKLYDLLYNKEMHLPRLKKIVVRDVGGEFGAWVEEEKVGLRLACGGVCVEGDFRSSFEVGRVG